MQTAYDIRVKGKVQGVFCRASTLKKAQEIGVQGWCKNLENGDVRIHAQGNRADLDELLLWCKEGSPKAIVEEIVFKEVEMETYTNFQIKH